MDPQEVATFFAVMLLGAAVGTVIAIARPSSRSVIADAAPTLAAAVAIGATLGSLYFSESAHFIPCELCWFQRIAMYPMAIMLPLAALRRDRSVLRYALALSVVGLGISGYHIQLQLFPDQGSFCEVANPCTGRWVDAFGWMTIPQMAGISFALIAVLTSLAILTPTKEIP